MKSKDLMMIIGGGLAAYMLIPQVKETVGEYIPGGGGSSGGSTILDFMPDFKFPEISIINELPGVKDIIEVVKEVPDKIPDPTDLIPGGGGVPDPQEVIDYILDLVGGGGHEEPGIPNPLDLLGGGSGLDLLGELKEISERYVENFGKGVLGIAEAGDFISGGWQESQSWPTIGGKTLLDHLTSAYARSLGGNTMTDYARAALERGTREPRPISTEVISNTEVPARSESVRPTFSGGKAPKYRPVSPTRDPRFNNKLSIVGVLGSGQVVHSLGTEPPPTKAKAWMFT